MILPTKQEQTQKTDLWLPTAAGRGGVAEGWTGVWTRSVELAEASYFIWNG